MELHHCPRQTSRVIHKKEATAFGGRGRYRNSFQAFFRRQQTDLGEEEGAVARETFPRSSCYSTVLYSTGVEPMGVTQFCTLTEPTESTSRTQGMLEQGGESLETLVWPHSDEHHAVSYRKECIFDSSIEGERPCHVCTYKRSTESRRCHVGVARLGRGRCVTRLVRGAPRRTGWQRGPPIDGPPQPTRSPPPPARRLRR
jgi:hypothetical protein